MKRIGMIWERRELLRSLITRDLKQRYKGSALGFLWSILTPLFMAVIYIIFLRKLAGRGVPTEEIILGVFAWQYTAQSVSGGITAITGNANLVKKVSFPRIILPTANVSANLINFVLSLLVAYILVFVLLLLKGTMISHLIILLPLVIVLHTILNLGLAFLVSSLNVYFRDTQHLVGVILTAWFFMSPAMYGLSFVERLASESAWMANVYMLNPMAPIITAYRAITMPEVSFPISPWSLTGLLLPILIICITRPLFKKMQNNFADML